MIPRFDKDMELQKIPAMRSQLLKCYNKKTFGTNFKSDEGREQMKMN